MQTATCDNDCMGKFLIRKRLQIWIACFAIFINRLAPSIFHTLSASDSSPGMMEICSVSGTKWISSDVFGPQVAEAESTSPASPLHHLEHYSYCITHAGNFALPAPSSMSFAAMVGHDVFPALFYHSPAALFSWSAAHPRGPPA